MECHRQSRCPVRTVPAQPVSVAAADSVETAVVPDVVVAVGRHSYLVDHRHNPDLEQVRPEGHLEDLRVSQASAFRL